MEETITDVTPQHARTSPVPPWNDLHQTDETGLGVVDIETEALVNFARH